MTLEEHIEQFYMDILINEGIGEDTIEWFKEMAEINHRTLSYFVIAAMQEFRISLDQDPSFLVELEDEEEASVH